PAPGAASLGIELKFFSCGIGVNGFSPVTGCPAIGVKLPPAVSPCTDGNSVLSFGSGGAPSPTLVTSGTAFLPRSLPISLSASALMSPSAGLPDLTGSTPVLTAGGAPCSRPCIYELAAVQTGLSLGGAAPGRPVTCPCKLPPATCF